MSAVLDGIRRRVADCRRLLEDAGLTGPYVLDIVQFNWSRLNNTGAHHGGTARCDRMVQARRDQRIRALFETPWVKPEVRVELPLPVLNIVHDYALQLRVSAVNQEILAKAAECHRIVSDDITEYNWAGLNDTGGTDHCDLLVQAYTDQRINGLPWMFGAWCRVKYQ